MRVRTSALAACLVAGTFAGCSLYFGDRDKNGAETDGGSDPADASDVADAAPGECELETGDAVSQLSLCMDREEFEAAGLCGLALMNTSAGTCESCHKDGKDGIQLHADCDITFEAMKTWPVQNHLIIPQEDEEGCFQAFDLGNVCNEEFTTVAHPPRFRCPNMIQAALASYIEESFARGDQGACAPAGDAP